MSAATESAPAMAGQGLAPPDSSIWQAAVNRYYDELRKGGIKPEVINKDLWDIKSPSDLIAQLEALSAPRSKTWTVDLNRLKTVLLALGDFAALTALVVNVNGRVAALLYGSVRLIVKV
jgi:hypothetical protein